jgi:pimeloyl-ACP methyl ester carboxylesterase
MSPRIDRDGSQRLIGQTGVSFIEQSVTVGSFEIRVVEAGSGDPIVYLHGGGGLHPSGALELLAESFRVVALQIPGFGRSAENRRTGSLDELAETMADAAAAAGVGAPYVLLGTSFGGATALHMALRSPDQISALVLESPAAFRPAGWSPPAPDAIRRALFAHPERMAAREPPDPEVVRKQQLLMSRLLDSIDQPALGQRLREVRVPTLVLFGTEDGLFPPEMGRTYRALMPNCSFMLVYDAAHEVGSDRPEAVAALVADFARRRETFIIGNQSTVLAP